MREYDQLTTLFVQLCDMLSRAHLVTSLLSSGLGSTVGGSALGGAVGLLLASVGGAGSERLLSVCEGSGCQSMHKRGR